MYKAWCKKVVSAAENQNDNKITTTNFTKTKPVNELAIAKEVQFVLDHRKTLCKRRNIREKERCCRKKIVRQQFPDEDDQCM